LRFVRCIDDRAQRFGHIVRRNVLQPCHVIPLAVIPR
jgi:hypothetical protein